MGGRRQPVGFAVGAAYVALAVLLVGLVYLAFVPVLLERSLSGFGRDDSDESSDDADELGSVLADVLLDAPASQRSGVTADQHGCGGGAGSPGARSSASVVWALPPGDEAAAAVASIEQRAVALGYVPGAVQDQVDQDQPVPLRFFERVEEPSVIEVRDRDVAAGTELTISVHVMCER